MVLQLRAVLASLESVGFRLQLVLPVRRARRARRAQRQLAFARRLPTIALRGSTVTRTVPARWAARILRLARRENTVAPIVCANVVVGTTPHASVETAVPRMTASTAWRIQNVQPETIADLAFARQRVTLVPRFPGALAPRRVAPDAVRRRPSSLPVVAAAMSNAPVASFVPPGPAKTRSCPMSVQAPPSLG